MTAPAEASYLDPAADLTDPLVCHAVQARSMNSVRTILAAYRHDLMGLMALRPYLRGEGIDVEWAIREGTILLNAAEAEVLRAERGCGEPEGECTDPCHAGVRGVSTTDLETTYA